MAKATVQDLKNENEIASEFLKNRGGSFQVFKDDPTAHFDRLYKKEGFYIFVECRQRSLTWAKLEFFGGVFIDTRKLHQLFYFIVRDKVMETRFAYISAERLLQLQALPCHKVLGQDGVYRPTVDVPCAWFEKLT